MKETKECISCLKETNSYYPVSTNKGRVYRCSECYEISICRELRDNYLQNNEYEKTEYRS